MLLPTGIIIDFVFIIVNSELDVAIVITNAWKALRVEGELGRWETRCFVGMMMMRGKATATALLWLRTAQRGGWIVHHGHHRKGRKWRRGRQIGVGCGCEGLPDVVVVVFIIIAVVQ